jgi:hypothetical protein
MLANIIRVVRWRVCVESRSILVRFRILSNSADFSWCNVCCEFGTQEQKRLVFAATTEWHVTCLTRHYVICGIPAFFQAPVRSALSSKRMPGSY